MKRMKVLFGQRRIMVLATLAILVLTAAALVASSASFTATSANPNNTFTAGSLDIVNGGLVFNADPMMPGDSKTGTVQLTNDGDGSADFYLTIASIVDSQLGTGTADLSDTLRLRVTDDATPANEVYNGRVSAFPLAGVNAGPFAANVSHTYTFVVTFPDSDAAPLTTKGSDNMYQGCRSVISFGWESVSN